MKTSLNSLKGLKKSLTVELPIASFEIKKDNIIKEISKNAHIDGFRKGKVPINVLKQRFLVKANSDASNEMVSESLPQALKDVKIIPAEQPALTKIDLDNKKVFSYTVEFEVFPDIEVKSFDNLNIEQFQSSIVAEDKNKTLEELKDKATEFKSVKRKSKTGDRLIIDFEGTINNEPFAGGAQENFEIIIGKGLTIAGFEEGITGVMPNKDKEIEVKAKFPADYSSQELSNKQVIFKIKVKEVGEPKKIKIDDALAKIYGDKNLEAMKNRIFTQMQKELDERLLQINKNKVFDAILEVNKFDVPQGSIKSEAQRLQIDMQQKMAQQGMPENNNIPQEMFQEEASRRIKLSLLINKIANNNKIVVKKEAVEARIKDIANTYAEEYDKVLNWYKEDKERMLSVESLITEEMIVKLITNKAKIKKIKKNFTNIMHTKN